MGPQQSHGSAFFGIAVEYKLKSDGTANLAHEVLHAAVLPQIDDVFPWPGNPPSLFRAQLAGRMVLDAWDPDFVTTQRGLADLGDYGVGRCAAIIHNWQHAGHDNALPEHYSANPNLGGDSGLQAAMQAGAADGCLLAVHENYGDYYPNDPTFNQASVAVTAQGNRSTGG